MCTCATSPGRAERHEMKTRLYQALVEFSPAARRSRQRQPAQRLRAKTGQHRYTSSVERTLLSAAFDCHPSKSNSKAADRNVRPRHFILQKPHAGRAAGSAQTRRLDPAASHCGAKRCGLSAQRPPGMLADRARESAGAARRISALITADTAICSAASPAAPIQAGRPPVPRPMPPVSGYPFEEYQPIDRAASAAGYLRRNDWRERGLMRSKVNRCRNHHGDGDVRGAGDARPAPTLPCGFS